MLHESFEVAATVVLYYLRSRNFPGITQSLHIILFPIILYGLHIFLYYGLVGSIQQRTVQLNVFQMELLRFRVFHLLERVATIR